MLATNEQSKIEEASGSQVVEAKKSDDFKAAFGDIDVEEPEAPSTSESSSVEERSLLPPPSSPAPVCEPQSASDLGKVFSKI